GKTAPRLLEDLLNYDPRNELLLGRNVLTTPPPREDLDNHATPVLPEDSCHHVFFEKLLPTDIVPPLDSRPDATTQYEIHAICYRCRHHLDLKIDYRGSFRSRADSGASISDSSFFPCPNKEFPLHHFQFIAEQPIPRLNGVGSISLDNQNSKDRSFLFKCSADSCLAKLSVTLRAPLFADEYVYLLSDRNALEARLQAAIVSDPERDDFKVARPVDAFDALSTYLRDGMDTGSGRRKIPVKNRRFMVTFGEDCRYLLESLGFRVGDEDDDDGGFCYLPNPSEHRDPEAFIAYLADVRNELFVHLSAQPEGDRSTLKNIPNARRPLLKDIERCLGYSDYDKIQSSRRRVDLTGAGDPFYAGLGALQDFSDQLIIFAFERQMRCDPENRGYYFDCLVEVESNRKNSEELGVKIALLRSDGYNTKKEIAAAYRYFGLDVNLRFTHGDDHIAGLYSSRLGSVPLSQHAECREQLRVIATARGSRTLMEIASNELETYDQALSYLDANASLPDDFVSSLFVTKTADDPASIDMARKALGIIANARNSTYLKGLLANGHADQPTMDVGEAYSTLQIDDRTSLSLEMLPVLLQSRIQEAPDREDDFNRAAAVLTSHYEAFPDQGDTLRDPQITRPAEQWPVGIHNLGATCYFNSLLQYLFAIKPLRDLLLSLEEHKMETSPRAIKSRRVGGRIVPAKEVQHYIDFAFELASFFEEMITTSSAVVKPSLKLASGTLKSTNPQSATARRRSTIGGSRPAGLGEIDGAAVHGPLPPIASANESEEVPPPKDEDQDEDPSSKQPTTDAPDSASDTTLVGDIRTPESDEDDMNDDPSPPARPPPVPPRPKVDTSKQADLLQEVEFLAKQQDVTEAMENVLFQLRCAIKPIDVEENGEQIDQITELFTGKVKMTYPRVTAGGKRVDSKVEAFTSLILQVDKGPTDIYSALDRIFDPEKVELNGRRISRYGTIEALPPILQINVNRVGWELKGPFKIEYPMKLEETLYMDRYVEGGPSMLKRRQATWKWKDELRELEARRDELVNTISSDTKLPDVLNAASEFVTSLQANGVQDDLMDVDPLAVDPDLSIHLQGRSDEVAKELKELETRISGLKMSIKDQFDGMEDQAYRLHALFIHRGSAGAGHYWIYIRDFKRGIWMTYNDERVTEETDLTKIFEQEDYTRVHPATPYFVVYVKDGLQDELVDSLCRIIPGASAQDVDMMGGEAQVIEGIEVKGG
ncbi:cysteine proteinase, partial [Rhizodiscina lignyota]